MRAAVDRPIARASGLTLRLWGLTPIGRARPARRAAEATVRAVTNPGPVERPAGRAQAERRWARLRGDGNLLGSRLEPSRASTGR